MLSGNILDSVLAFREQRFGPLTTFSSVVFRTLLALRYLVMICLL